jgi:nucleolin
MTTSLVTPGAKVGHHPSQMAGPGVAVQGDDLIATVVGQPTEADGVISVLPARHVINIDIGDRIIATVDKVQEKNAEVVVLAVEGKGEAPVATQLRAQVRVTDIVDRFLHQVSDGLRRRDVCRLTVTAVDPVLRADMRQDAGDGVLHALCQHCGASLNAEQDGDWNLRCPTCDERTFRALADGYGGGEGASALNGDGKRWSGASEALFAKGPAARASFLAEDVREDGRPRDYPRFESDGRSGGGGGGGRRPSHAPGCRLFIGGLDRGVDTDKLRDIFGAHGEMSDCVVMTDDAGASRGFGFVTFTSKASADAAVKALDQTKINGRKVGVRDADAKQERGERKPRGPKGTKLYVGNLSFGTDADALKALVAEHADVVAVELAMDGERSKGFGFVFIDPAADAEAVVGALKGSEVDGRTIRVDVAKSGGGRRGGGDRDRGGGGKGGESREERAKREEAGGGGRRRRGRRN